MNKHIAHVIILLAMSGCGLVFAAGCLHARSLAAKWERLDRPGDLGAAGNWLGLASIGLFAACTFDVVFWIVTIRRRGR